MANAVQSQNPLARKPIPLPSVERVRELFDYDQKTGVLTTRTARPKSPVGTRVGTINSWGRRICRVDYKTYYVHRIVWLHYYGLPTPEIIDHVNGDVLDNRICNLREADKFQNSWNGNGRGAKSGIKGAHWSNYENKWRSSIKRNGKFYHLGWFSTKEDAAAAYAEASIANDGEFSVFCREKPSPIT